MASHDLQVRGEFKGLARMDGEIELAVKGETEDGKRVWMLAPLSVTNLLDLQRECGRALCQLYHAKERK